MMLMTARHVFMILALLALGACSNGRGSVGEQAGAPVEEAPPDPPPAPPPDEPPEDPPPEPPPDPEPPPPPEPEPDPEPAQPSGSALAGYWSGEVTDEDSGRAREGIAFVDLQGDMQLMVLRDRDEPEFVVHGNVCCDATAEEEIEGNRYLNTRDEEAEIEVALSDGRLAGELGFRDRDYEFSLAPLAAYNEPLTLQDLAGVYTRTDASGLIPQTMTMTIDPDGRLTGSQSNGCILNGTVSVPDSTRNMVSLEIELSECGGFGSSRRWNGSYRGLGVLLRDAISPSDGVTREDIFYHSIVGPTWLGPQSVGR